MSDAVLKSTVAKRSSRFKGDNKNVALYYERSKNANVVVYEVLTVPAPEHGGKKLKPSDTIDAYWLDLEPSYQAKKRAKGIESDRDELNFVERWKAYGATAENVEAHRATVKFVALADRVMDLTLEKVDGELYPFIHTTLNGKAGCIVEKIYVLSDESGWLLPTVVHIDIHGTDPKTGEAVMERVKP